MEDRELVALVLGEPDLGLVELQLENFARAVAGEEPPLLGRDDAVAQARVLDALLRSAETGAPVSLQ